MGQASGESRWAPFAELLAITANSNRNPKRTPRAFKASDFNPYAKDRKRKRKRGAIEITEKTIGDVRQFFTGMKKGT